MNPVNMADTRRAGSSGKASPPPPDPATSTLSGLPVNSAV